MDESLKIVLGLGILLVLFGAGYFLIGEGPTVSAQGISSLEVTPDIVSIYLTIEARDKTSASAAQSAHKILSDDLADALRSLGIAESEIKTSYYNVGPEYDWTQDGQKLKGYLVTQQVVVELKDFSRVVDVVDAAVNSGVLVSGINFELSPEKQSEYKTQALEQASADAKNKASATAAGLGKKLGKLVSVESQDFNYGPVVYYAKGDSFSGVAEARDAALQITPTDLNVYANVGVTYTIR
ncbi:MAG: SIMPL domain-containing protein [Candidatus Pacearchaeota archaeon]